MSPLIERLRQKAGQYDEYDWHSVTELEAADALERMGAERDALRADAMWYRFIFAESGSVDPVCAVVWKKGNVRNSSEWVNSVGGEWLSKELDDAIGEKHD